MTRAVLLVAVLSVLPLTSFAQSQAETEAAIRRLVPYATMKRDLPTLTLGQYEAAIRALAQEQARMQPALPARPPTPSRRQSLGRLSTNPYLPESTSKSLRALREPLRAR